MTESEAMEARGWRTIENEFRTRKPTFGLCEAVRLLGKDIDAHVYYSMKRKIDVAVADTSRFAGNGAYLWDDSRFERRTERADLCAKFAEELEGK